MTGLAFFAVLIVVICVVGIVGIREQITRKQIGARPNKHDQMAEHGKALEILGSPHTSCSNSNCVASSSYNKRPIAPCGKCYKCCPECAIEQANDPEVMIAYYERQLDEQRRRELGE